MPIPRLDAETYLALDREAEWKSELHDGEMFPIEAVSLQHSRILVNLVGTLRPHLRAKGCEGLPGPLRVRISELKFVYPDYFVVCGKAQLTDELADTVTNPKVVIEILSPSTANYDQGKKFRFYQQLSSLTEYVLIAQEKARVDVYTKENEEEWRLRIYEGPGKSAKLESIGVELPVAELFDGVEFPA